MPPPDPAAFFHLATVCDEARATTSKLAKTAALAAYLRTLPPTDVPLAVRFLAAQPFTPSSGKSLAMGGALVVEAIRQTLGIDPATLHRAFHERGEIGEAVRSHWAIEPQLPPLSLADVQAGFDDIRRTGVQEEKRRVLIAMLRRCLPPEAVYLLKIILGDMRTGVSEGVVEMAVAEAFGSKLADVRRARLLEGDLDAVALLAAEHRLDQAQFRPFHPLGYMLAQPTMTAAEAIETLVSRPAIAEDKYDGIRAQAHVVGAPSLAGGHKPEDGTRVELFSRGAGAVTESFPDIIVPLADFARATGRAFVLDGEIVPLRVAPGREPVTLPFSVLQTRLRRKTPTAKLLRENPCAFVAFDLLWLDGELLLDRPLSERRAALIALASAQPPFVLGPAEPVTDATALDLAFAAARARRNEGLVLKRLDSPYTPGRRGDAWLKLKSHLPTLDCVVVGVERGHGKRNNVLSDVTFAVRKTDAPDAELITIGKAYSGLTDAEIAELTERFIAETIEERGRYRILRPTVVMEIAFDQITRSPRHTSGYAMRFPRIVRLRPDKSAADADTLARVQQIYTSPDNLAVGEHTTETVKDPDQLSLF